MLIRKSLCGNLRPTPGDLYDPRDGSCMPNFHLSTTHNPNLHHIKQDLVKYDIQLTRELPGSKNATSTTNKKEAIEGNITGVQSNNLMLLVIAQYSEGLVVEEGTPQPFVIQRVFYREAVASMLHLKRIVDDRHIALIESNLRICIPNPKNLKLRLLEQFKMSLSKVSIIQHGQEYHYTNIGMALMEISKIVNQVCSPGNFNARSIIVEIPPVLSYTILDKNRYLAYLHEKQRILRERDEGRRNRDLYLRYQDLPQPQMDEGQIYQGGQRYTKHALSITESGVLHGSHATASEISHQVMNRIASRTGYYPGPQYKGRFVKYPIETSIRTVNGKKIVTYHDTGESFIYEDLSNKGNDSKQLRPNEKSSSLGHNHGLNLSKKFSKSTPNLAQDDELPAVKRSSENRTKDDSYGYGSSVPYESYLRDRSRSFGYINETDKIDRYPSLLIVPGRKSVRNNLDKDDWVDKWKKKSPKFWGANVTNNKLNVATKSQVKINRANPPRPPPISKKPVNLSAASRTKKSIVNSITTLKSKNLNVNSNDNFTTANKGAPRTQLTNTGPPQERRLSIVSTFSDISVSQQQQADAEAYFEHYHVEPQAPEPQGVSHAAHNTPREIVPEPTPSVTVQQLGKGTAERQLLYKAYPVKVTRVTD